MSEIWFGFTLNIWYTHHIREKEVENILSATISDKTEAFIWTSTLLVMKIYMQIIAQFRVL